MAHVLVVEDDLDTLCWICMLVKFAGHEVECASNGLEALPMIEELQPDVILLDVFMPVMSGLEMLAHLRQDPGMPNCRVIVMSAAMEPGIERRALVELGADGCVKKCDLDETTLNLLINARCIAA